MSKEGKSQELIGFEALEKAREAFDKHIEDYGYDSGYFDIRFTAWILTMNFDRWKRIELEDEVKDEQNHKSKEAS
jgi:hypothetical protein